MRHPGGGSTACVTRTQAFDAGVRGLHVGEKTYLEVQSYLQSHHPVLWEAVSKPGFHMLGLCTTLYIQLISFQHLGRIDPK